MNYSCCCITDMDKSTECMHMQPACMQRPTAHICVRQTLHYAAAFNDAPRHSLAPHYGKFFCINRAAMRGSRQPAGAMQQTSHHAGRHAPVMALHPMLDRATVRKRCCHPHHPHAHTCLPACLPLSLHCVPWSHPVCNTLRHTLPVQSRSRSSVP